MGLFESYPTYSPYRTLRLATPLITGADVFALQTALQGIGFSPGELDGVFGPRTDWSVRAAQSRLEITVDGLAGGGTQTALCRRIAAEFQGDYELPDRLLFGQIMHESSCRLGNYSARREDGSYDAGAAQRNTRFTAAKQGFTAPASVDALGKNTREFYNRFNGVVGRRRWELAAGSWNAPAYANWLANQEGARVPTNTTARPGVTARRKLEEYMASATALMED